MLHDAQRLSPFEQGASWSIPNEHYCQFLAEIKPYPSSLSQSIGIGSDSPLTGVVDGPKKNFAEQSYALSTNFNYTNVKPPHAFTPSLIIGFIWLWGAGLNSGSISDTEIVLKPNWTVLGSLITRTGKVSNTYFLLHIIPVLTGFGNGLWLLFSSLVNSSIHECFTIITLKPSSSTARSTRS